MKHPFITRIFLSAVFPSHFLGFFFITGWGTCMWVSPFVCSLDSKKIKHDQTKKSIENEIKPTDRISKARNWFFTWGPVPRSINSCPNSVRPFGFLRVFACLLLHWASNEERKTKFRLFVGTLYPDVRSTSQHVHIAHWACSKSILRWKGFGQYQWTWYLSIQNNLLFRCTVLNGLRWWANLF